MVWRGCAAPAALRCADLAASDISVKFLFGHDGRGIGAVDVHPSLTYIAVAEKGDSPNVYLYEYPSLKVFRILRKGTERAYSDVTFSADGNLLATVGAAPDFLLTVWDWRQERMVLRTKAFSQEVRRPRRFCAFCLVSRVLRSRVARWSCNRGRALPSMATLAWGPPCLRRSRQVFNVRFSPENPGRLTTSGTGHVRFWRMAETFTGCALAACCLLPAALLPCSLAPPPLVVPH